MSTYLLEISYIIASVSFIIGLKRMSHPEKARSGNLLACSGMGLAIFLTIFFHDSVGIANPNLIYIFIAILFGQISRGLTILSSEKPQLIIALADNPIFSGN